MAGLLDAFKQYISDVMPGGVLNPEGSQVSPAFKRGAEELRQGLLAYGAANKAAIENPTWGNVKAAVDNNMTAAGVAPLGMTVWHGSPHKFTKFDMSKIGTGEGAQAYGHGLYMAETPEVAKSYINAQRDQSAGSIAEKYLKNWGDKGKAIAALEKQVAKAKEEFKPEYVAPYIDALGMLKKGQSDFGGALYKVDIPDEAVARFLDWDKKLSEQIPEVQAVAKQWNNGTLPTGIQSGDELLRYIQQQLRFIGSPKKAEQVLNEAGIPGIRYLDGGSRSAGQGSSNFVLFDDQLPRILETNGVPTGNQAWKPGEWQGLLGGM